MYGPILEGAAHSSGLNHSRTLLEVCLLVDSRSNQVDKQEPFVSVFMENAVILFIIFTLALIL